jgi:hypothetical protein
MLEIDFDDLDCILDSKEENNFGGTARRLDGHCKVSRYESSVSTGLGEARNAGEARGTICCCRSSRGAGVVRMAITHAEAMRIS